MPDFHLAFEKVNATIAELSRGMLDLHRRLAEEAPCIEKRLSEFDDEMIDFLQEASTDNLLGRKVAFSMFILAQQGWYFSHWDTPLAGVTQSAAMFERGEAEKADAALASHIESLIPSMHRHVTDRIPERLEILDDALDAHRAKKFTLSIPVFLAQADGIGAEVFNIDSIYSRSKEGIAKLKKAIHAKTSNDAGSDYFYLVASLMPINASFKRRLFYQNGLNRNSVLHGESTNYPSYINSCKALSWLQYMIWIKQHFDMFEDIRQSDPSS